MKEYSRKESKSFKGLVVAHAAQSGNMMTIFGRHFAKRLIEEGAQLHFFASSLPIAGMAPPLGDVENLGGYFHGLYLPERFTPIQAIKCIIQMTLMLRKFGVKVLHTRATIMAGVGLVAGNLAGVPIIIHHQDDLYCRDSRLSPVKKRLWAFLEMSLSRLADKVLFVSQTVIKDAVAIGFRQAQCVLVGHDLGEVFQNAATNPDSQNKTLVARLRDLGVPENAHIVGCVGRLTYHKGIDLLIEAAEKLVTEFPQWVFVIKGSGLLLDEFRSLIQKKGLNNKIFLFTEELSGEDLPLLFRCFDIFALPTRREGFGMVFAEAMAMGVPVVGPRMTPVTEVVPEGCGILTEPENISALVSGLSKLMSDRSLRQQYGDAGRKYALSTWCGQESANRVLDVYQDLLDRANV